MKKSNSKRHSISPSIADRVINTVMELKAANELGRILTYEHLLINGTKLYQKPTLLKKYDSCFYKLNMPNLGFISYEPYSCRENLIFNDQAQSHICYDLQLFKISGGGTIVEHTVNSMRPEKYFHTLRWLSAESKINIIVGTGYACANVEPAETHSLTEEDMYNSMKHQIENGCDDDVRIKAAFIGEIGCSWPIDACEKRALTAAGQLQQQLKLPVSLNPGANVSAPDEMLRIYTEAGGKEEKAIMCHLDRLMDEEQIINFFDGTKCFCQFSNFGTEISYCQVNPEVAVLSDAQRIEYLWHFKKHKQMNRILFSHGIHTRHRLVRFGGHGFSHIDNSVVPFMKFKGFSSADVKTVMITNPLRWLVAS